MCKAHLCSASLSLPLDVLSFPWAPRYLLPSLSHQSDKWLTVGHWTVHALERWQRVTRAFYHTVKRGIKGVWGKGRFFMQFVFYFLLFAFLLSLFKKAFLFWLISLCWSPCPTPTPSLHYGPLKFIGWNPVVSVTVTRAEPSWMGLMSFKRDPRELPHYLHV